MARPRKRGAKDLPLGLYRDDCTGVYYIKWKGKQVSLRTKDKRAALALYNQIFPSLKQQYIETQAKRIAAQLNQVTLVPGSQTFAAYAESWRENVLPNATKKNGEPLANKTRADYDRMLRNQVTPSDHFKVTVQEVTASVLRRFLSTWLDTPHFYNYIRAVLSRILEAAVDEGLLERNPAADVSKRPTGKRQVYLEDSDYLAITEQIKEEWVASVS